MEWQIGAAWSGSALFAKACLSENLGLFKASIGEGNKYLCTVSIQVVTRLATHQAERQNWTKILKCKQ